MKPGFITVAYLELYYHDYTVRVAQQDSWRENVLFVSHLIRLPLMKAVLMSLLALLCMSEQRVRRGLGPQCMYS